MTEAYLSRRIQAEALRCTRYFKRVGFEDCIPLAIKNPQIPHAPGIYAIKDHTNKILYVGKAVDLWMRFKRHEVLLEILISGYQAKDLRVAIVLITPALINYLRAIEDRVIFALEPPYNSYIPKLGF